jgi:hypothetical protein
MGGPKTSLDSMKRRKIVPLPGLGLNPLADRHQSVAIPPVLTWLTFLINLHFINLLYTAD